MSTASRQAPNYGEELPWSPNAERMILGAVLAGLLDFGQLAQTLNDKDFYLQKHKLICQRMGDLYSRGVRIIDYETLAQELMRRKDELESVGGLSYLTGMADGIPQLPNFDAWIESIRFKAFKRRVIHGADKLATLALREDADVSGLSNATEVINRELRSAQGAQAEASGKIEWPVLREEALHGPVGHLLRALDPHTEADQAALLIQALVAWGSVLGRGPYYQTEADRHHGNLFAVIVGTTSKARKGTSWNRIRSIMHEVDETWTRKSVVSGIGSGEALIEAIAEGDQRCLVVEPELARVLSIMQRDGCTLSAIWRAGWDSGVLALRTRQDNVSAKEAHLSIIGHITEDELRRRLCDTDMANGLANRILWVCARRSKLLPYGGGDVDVRSLAKGFLEAIEFSKKQTVRAQFDSAAHALWGEIYGRLSEGRPGLFGAMTSRAEAQVVRIALIYALLDRTIDISEQHLRAALAVWDYCHASARYIWGDALGDPVADSLLTVLRVVPNGMTRWEISNHLGRNKASAEIDRALDVLISLGLIHMSLEETVGVRPAKRYRAV